MLCHDIDHFLNVNLTFECPMGNYVVAMSGTRSEKAK